MMRREPQVLIPSLLKLCTCALAWCGLAVAVGAAEIALLDGRTLEGDVKSWRDGTLQVETEDGGIDLLAEEVLRIRFAPMTEGEPAATVEFIDGSVMPIERFTVRDGEATIQVAGVKEPLVAGTQKISAVHLLPPTDRIAAQWNDVRQTDEAGDLIVIRKEEGAVDYLAGRLGDITHTHVVFYLDEDEYPVDRNKVDGVVYYKAQPPSFADPLCVLRGNGGLKLLASSVRFDGEKFAVRTSGGIDIGLSPERVHAADFSGGKIIYLSELTPRSVTATPLVALGGSADLAARMVEPVMDRGFFSPEALLRHPRYDGETIVGWELRPHRQSLGLRSRSDVVYQMPEGFTEFRALAGIDGTLGGRGNVHLSVFGDNRLLWEQAIDGGGALVTMDIEIAGVRRLRILVDYGAGGDAADRLYLCEARITK